ncbi:MAG: hypothetical protein ACLTBF_03600 [Christensenellales bacterium]
MKWPKIKIRREAVERALIISSAALVLLLSLKRTSTNNEPYEEPLNEIPEVSVSTTQTEDTRQTVVYYEDGDGYLVPFSAMLPGKMALPRPRSN